MADLRNLINRIQEMQGAGGAPSAAPAVKRDPNGYVASHRYGRNTPSELAQHYMEQLAGLTPSVDRMPRAADTEVRRMARLPADEAGSPEGPRPRRRRNGPLTGPASEGVEQFQAQPSRSRSSGQARGKGGGGMTTEDEMEQVHNAMEEGQEGSSSSQMNDLGPEPTEQEQIDLMDKVDQDMPLSPRDKQVLYWLREWGMNPSSTNSGELMDVPAGNARARTSAGRVSARR